MSATRVPVLFETYEAGVFPQGAAQIEDRAIRSRASCADAVLGLPDRMSPAE